MWSRACTSFEGQRTTQQLHKLIDSNASQAVINERIAGLMEHTNQTLERVGGDHEKRLRYLERTVAWALGTIGAIATAILIASKLLK